MTTPSAPETATAAALAKTRAAELLQIEDEYYDILAGGTRVAMMIAMIDIGLAHLLVQRGPLSEPEIIEALALHHGRAHKWLLILESVGLLIREPSAASATDDPGVVRYQQSKVCRALVDPTAPNYFFYRDFLRYWRVAASKELTTLLRGAPVSDPVRYPPVLWDDVLLLHDWMRDGALTTLASIQRRFDFARYRHILDVAGGDATMAITLARQFPALRLTVFNLPAAATLGRRNVEAAGLGDRIAVVTGDFRTDPLPAGAELIMFSRVMADWSPSICRMLMQKSHAALAPGGALLIAEPLEDENRALSIVWHHSYLPYDDFGAAVYKTQATYEKLLAETGFRLVAAHGRDDTIHSVLLAEKI